MVKRSAFRLGVFRFGLSERFGGCRLRRTRSSQATNFRHHGFFTDSTGFFIMGGTTETGRGAAGEGACRMFFRALNRATSSLPGVGDGITRTADPSVRRAASTGTLCWISAAPRRSRLTTASAVSSSNAIHRTMGTPETDRGEHRGLDVLHCTRGCTNLGWDSCRARSFSRAHDSLEDGTSGLTGIENEFGV